MKFQTLYKRTSAGVLNVWDIESRGNIIVTRWGQMGGAIQETRDVVAGGKNIGRSNETTPAQQAESEARSRWEKKVKKGYVESLARARRGGVDDQVIKGGVFPMLAHSLDKQGHKLRYPCHAQPKLDGHRCIAMIDADGACTLWTRSRKPITSMNHIASAVESLGLRDTILDGELYNHAYRDRFEELSSFIRDTEAKPGSIEVQYHIYDMVTHGTFRERLQELLAITPASEHIVFVRTAAISDEEQLMDHFAECLRQGYEGSIARNSDGLYVQNKRSYDLFKVKEFADSEFEVTGVEEGRGKLAAHAGAFICRTADGTEFRAKLMGKLDDLRQYYDDPSLAIGRMLTVKYQGFTNKSGVPRFPVAVRFREDL